MLSKTRRSCWSLLYKSSSAPGSAMQCDAAFFAFRSKRDAWPVACQAPLSPATRDARVSKGCGLRLLRPQVVRLFQNDVKARYRGVFGTFAAAMLAGQAGRAHPQLSCPLHASRLRLPERPVCCYLSTRVAGRTWLLSSVESWLGAELTEAGLEGCSDQNCAIMPVRLLGNKLKVTQNRRRYE